MTTPHTASVTVFVSFTHTFEIEIPIPVGEDTDDGEVHLAATQTAQQLTRDELESRASPNARS